MTDAENAIRFRQAASCLSPSIQRRLSEYTGRLSRDASELRLRVNRPFSVVCKSREYYFGKNGLSDNCFESGLLTVTKKDISDTFQLICNYSVFSKQTEIVNGFVTLKGGHRAGICGTAVNGDDSITNIRDISSVNIRIAREHRGCAEELVKRLGDTGGGVLICGEPCSGKTTVLRDFARIISAKHRVTLIDERGELAGTVAGVYQNNIGMCDVFDGYRKRDAMEQSLRAMSPEVIVCDEIGSEDDYRAVEQCVNSGIALVATAHAADEGELLRKKSLRGLIELGAFGRIVYLSGRSCPGEVKRIARVGEGIGVKNRG